LSSLSFSSAVPSEKASGRQDAQHHASSGRLIDHEVTFDKHSATHDWSTSGIPAGSIAVFYDIIQSPSMGNESWFVQFYGDGTYWTSATVGLYITALTNVGASEYYKSYVAMGSATTTTYPYGSVRNFGPVFGGSRITACTGGGACLTQMASDSTRTAQFNNAMFATGYFPVYSKCQHCGVDGPYGIYGNVMQPSLSNPTNFFTNYGTNFCMAVDNFHPASNPSKWVWLVNVGVPTSYTLCQHSMGGYTSVNGIVVDSSISTVLAAFTWVEHWGIHEGSGANLSLVQKCGFWPGTSEYSTSTTSYAYGQYGPSSLDFSGTTGGLYNTVLAGTKYLLSAIYDGANNSCRSQVYY